jgi:hypothetical protein
VCLLQGSGGHSREPRQPRGSFALRFLVAWVRRALVTNIERPVRSGLRIRHVIIFVLHVALALATIHFALVFFLKPMPLFLAGPLVLIVLPVIVGCLSLRILRPGPRRDWVAGLFFTLALLVGSLATSAVAGYLLVTFQGFRAGESSPFFIRLSRILLVLPFGVIYLLLGVKWARLYLIPVRCPRCERRRLLRAWMQETRVARPFFNMRCAACGFSGCVRGAQMGQGCPQCGCRALTVLDYVYYWCLGCGSRLKRLGLGQWDDASSEKDDGPYWSVRRGYP